MTCPRCGNPGRQLLPQRFDQQTGTTRRTCLQGHVWREPVTGGPRGAGLAPTTTAFRPDGSSSKTYKIVRMYQRRGKRTIRTGLTLEEAKAWCRDPETSSRTAMRSDRLRRTAKYGPWFEGFEEE